MSWLRIFSQLEGMIIRSPCNLASWAIIFLSSMEGAVLSSRASTLQQSAACNTARITQGRRLIILHHTGLCYFYLAVSFTHHLMTHTGISAWVSWLTGVLGKPWRAGWRAPLLLELLWKTQRHSRIYYWFITHLLWLLQTDCSTREGCSSSLFLQP